MKNVDKSYTVQISNYVQPAKCKQLKFSVTEKTCVCWTEVAAGQHGAFAFLFPPMLSVWVGVAPRRFFILWPRFTCVPPRRPKSRQNSQTGRSPSMATAISACGIISSSRSDRVHAGLTETNVNITNFATKSRSMLSWRRSDPAEAGIPGKWWRVKLEQNHTWTVRQAGCLSAFLLVSARGVSEDTYKVVKCNFSSYFSESATLWERHALFFVIL